MAGTRRRWDREKDGALASEVAYVCVNGIYEFRHRRHAAEVHRLRELAECGYGRARKTSDFVAQLDKLFARAIERLEEPERQAAPHSFGLRGSNSYQKDLNTRQENAAEAYSEVIKKKISQLTYRQKPEYERAIIVNVGQAIEELDTEAAEQGQKAPTESRSLSTYKQYTTPYVRRPHYHDAFEAALNDGYRVIVFVGPPGVGKSRLVDQILTDRRRAHDSRFDFECRDLRDFVSEVALALQSRGMQAQRLTDEQLIRNFTLLIHSQKSPKYVVLHHPHDPSLLRSIDPAKLATTIVVINNYRLAQVPYLTHIEVKPPHPEEAMEIARHLLPDKSDSELSQLIDTVGHSPQALENAVEFLSREGFPLAVSTFCRTFTRDASLILRSSGSDLLRCFQDTFEALQGSRPDAAEVLEHLVFLADFVSIELLVSAIAKKNDSTPEEIDVIHQVALRALDVLHANSLISLDDGYVRLYKLAQVIGHRLVHSEGSDEIAGRLRSIIREQMAHVSRDQEQEPRSIEKFMDAARPLVNNLFHVENNATGRRSREEAGREVARAIQDLWGDFDIGPLVEITPVVEQDQLVIHKLTFRLDLTRYGESVRRELEKIARESDLAISSED